MSKKILKTDCCYCYEFDVILSIDILRVVDRIFWNRKIDQWNIKKCERIKYTSLERDQYQSSSKLGYDPASNTVDIIKFILQ